MNIELFKNVEIIINEGERNGFCNYIMQLKAEGGSYRHVNCVEDIIKECEINDKLKGLMLTYMSIFINHEKQKYIFPKDNEKKRAIKLLYKVKMEFLKLELDNTIETLIDEF